MKNMAALLTFVVITAASVAAHHGWAGYSEEEFEITGTLETQVSLAGAHGTMKIRVDGQVWDITLAPPARVQGAGLTSASIPLGAKVTVHGHRHRDPKRFEVKTERVTYQGKLYNVYPDRK
jgi:Family of unknown function (DUF6152)